jgi:hypothetical protein
MTLSAGQIFLSLFAARTFARLTAVLFGLVLTSTKAILTCRQLSDSDNHR